MSDPVQDAVPSSLDDAVDRVIATMSDLDKHQLRTGATLSHHGFGTALRNGWSLWDLTTPLSRWFQKNLGLCHGDDLSGMIFTAVTAKIRGEPFDPQVEAQRYKDHWARSGCNPMDQVKPEK